MNVYDSLKPWPAGTQIKELRVLQVLPMSVPSGGPPHETGLRVATAGDSVVPARWVLGTVPVEADGSAHFNVPANKEMFFQALDERGLAVQSMRSATYLHEGEHLVCAGCHEPKHRSPQPLEDRAAGPAAAAFAAEARRGRLEPVQLSAAGAAGAGPALREVPRRAARTRRRTWPASRWSGRWYASYANLVQQYGFHDYGDSLPHHPRPVRRPGLEAVRAARRRATTT